MMPAQTVVAIPVQNEESRIGNCLAALARQTVAPDHVVLLLNNCTDGTLRVIRDSPKAGRRLSVLERTLTGTSAGAGVARGLAMNHASLLIERGVILTTDADAEVPEDWVRASLRAIEEGADAVCGVAVIDPIEALLIPRHLHEDDAREAAYGRLLDTIESIMLPDAADPWPRHTEESGASIAVTRSMFRRIGGGRWSCSGEDRALMAKLRRVDARIRHDPAIRVIVSGRIEGRAPGGMADTIRRRMVKQDEFVDERIEPARFALRRLRSKRHFSRLWNQAGERPLHRFAAALAMTPNTLAEAIDAPYFGLGWSQIEQSSPVLERRRVRFAELPRETAIARRIHHALVQQTHPMDCGCAVA